MDNTLIKKMIVHPGPCHRDDLLCMAVMVYCRAVEIERREPTEDELNDPKTLVVDVGGRHDPELNNYDHHQLPRDAEPEWAFGLMLRGMFPSLAQVFESTNWFATSRMMDSKGPFAVANELGLPTTWTQELWSPLEEALTDMIEKKSSIKRNSDLWNMLGLLGEQLEDNATTWYKALTDLGETTQVMDIKGVQVLYITQVMNGVEENAMAKLQRERWPEAGAMVSFDNRGDGLTFYRFNDHPKVDFSRLQDAGEMLFTHPGGFIAKTKERLPGAEMLRLLEAAIG